MIKTLHFKLRNPSHTWLRKASFEVNTVWNHVNQTSYKAIRKFYGKSEYLSAFDLIYTMKGVTKSTSNEHGFDHINFATVASVIDEYVTRRIQFKKAKLKWRTSEGQRKSQSWIPFKKESLSIRVDGARLTGKINFPSKKIIFHRFCQTMIFTLDKSLSYFINNTSNLNDYQVFQKKSYDEVYQKEALIQEKARINHVKKKNKAHIKDLTIKILGRNFSLYNDKQLHLYLEDLQADVKSGNFSEDSIGDWYLNVSVEIEDEVYFNYLVEHKGYALIAPNEIVGIDPGVKNMIACSNGVIIPAQHFYAKQEEKLASLQRNGRLKQAKRLNRKIKNQRNDFTQKLSTDLVKNNQDIRFGNINVAAIAMKESKKKRKARKRQLKREAELVAEGLPLVKRNSRKKKNHKPRLGKALLDNNIGLLKQQLTCKSHWAGRSFHVVDEKYTTQVCPNCYAFTGPKGLKQLVVRTWICSECGSEHDRDGASATCIKHVTPGLNLIQSVSRCHAQWVKRKASQGSVCRNENKQKSSSFIPDSVLSLEWMNRDKALFC